MFWIKFFELNLIKMFSENLQLFQYPLYDILTKSTTPYYYNPPPCNWALENKLHAFLISMADISTMKIILFRNRLARLTYLPKYKRYINTYFTFEMDPE